MNEESRQSGFQRYEERIRAPRILFWIFIVMSIAVPVIGLAACFNLSSEAHSAWFQRSGSLVIACAVVAEYFAVSVFTTLNPNGFVSVGYKEFKEKYGALPARYTRIVLVLVVMGTLISGYGNLLFSKP